MTELPFEILRLISQFLWRGDLVQFQLVNKQWHEASSESLYSHALIDDDRAALLYIRTISNSRRFASYLKTFDTGILFLQFQVDPIMWDKNNVLGAVAKYCVNLHSISAYRSPPMLWSRLMLAASQGQLPNLQKLPKFKDEHIGLYACTALAFRKSLNTLHLVDHEDEFRREKYKMNARFFHELLDHIEEFPNLKNLTIKHCTNQPFSHIVDSIIDDCPHLIKLNVALYQSDLPAASIAQNVLAIPKPNISILTCHWMRIYKDDELKYVMRKFPNLQHLQVKRDLSEDSQAYETSYDIMMEFIKYISSIKKLDLFFTCKRRDIIYYWKELCKLRKTEASKITYINYTPSANDSVVSTYYTEKCLRMTFVINSSTDVLPHEEFLCEHGDEIKKLSINYTSESYQRLDDTSSMRYILSSENWIYQILQSCPSLQKLHFTNLVNLRLPGNSMYQHTELKKLKITDSEEITSLKFLKNLSFHVPNLKELKIYSCQHINNENGYCIEIDMPYTSFDVIKMRFEQSLDDMEDFYVKLNTSLNEKYYYIDSTGKRELTYSTYLKSNKRCLYEITCRSLKTLQLARYDTESTGPYYLSIHFKI